ncbi:F-box/RNI-like/FBD-like domains-containing protein [Striga asiatica]|uniref:F-box/RNI-like/FBD-like domains-containing protein n=1 Tax=Striga asiatica TaxID=4170 RepID=A0A5A7R6R1_STRAF|nr:F-box/RNI-like/FBD-like domains-containing protein [Striga asiatica]
MMAFSYGCQPLSTPTYCSISEPSYGCSCISARTSERCFFCNQSACGSLVDSGLLSGFIHFPQLLQLGNPPRGRSRLIRRKLEFLNKGLPLAPPDVVIQSFEDGKSAPSLSCAKAKTYS